VYLAEYGQYLCALQNMKAKHIALTRRDPLKRLPPSITKGVSVFLSAASHQLIDAPNSTAKAVATLLSRADSDEQYARAMFEVPGRFDVAPTLRSAIPSELPAE